MRAADFASLAEALDYAARGETGFNFYTGKNNDSAVLPYSELRDDAKTLARRLTSLGLERGARVALVADTDPGFVRFFFACQYAGLIPVPLPGSINLGNRDAYVGQLRRMLVSSRAGAVVAPTGFVAFVMEAAEGLPLRFVGDPEGFAHCPEKGVKLRPLQSTEVAYLQYTSGSTRFPRGVMITQHAVLRNLAGIIRHGVRIAPGDRCVSWLPFYHDMGLVGLVLVPVASQMSVDYLSTRDFAMRPRRWLELIALNQATISFSPPFGYELCARRLRSDDVGRFDLRSWRVAGVGAEIIRSEPLARFAQLLAPAGFDEKAFLACYGMAECSLAVSFAPLARGLKVDRVDGDHLAEYGEALPAAEIPAREGAAHVSTFADCGMPLPGYEVEIRDDAGRALLERQCGTIFVRGPSVMTGYFGDTRATRQTLSRDGWLDTGDVGYWLENSLVVTGRKKDLIILHGRNIWPQDVEHLAEQQPEVRPGDALAFSAPGPDGEEIPIMVVQCRESDEAKRASLVERLRRLVRLELGLECAIELVPLHTLPRTSSGKLSRSRARLNFIESQPAKTRADEPGGRAQSGAGPSEPQQANGSFASKPAPTPLRTRR